MKTPAWILLIVVGTFASQYHAFRLNDESSLSQRIVGAQKILSDTPAGLKVIKDISAYGVYAEPINIVTMDKGELVREHRADAGGIRLNSSGKYEIVINDELSDRDLAHTVAHELQHIRDEISSRRIMEQYPELKGKIQQAVVSLYMGKVDRALKEFEKETVFTLQSLFCSELKAYQVNEDLAVQGVPHFNANPSMYGLAQYIERHYIRRYGVRFQPKAVEGLTQECVQAQDLGTYQASLIKALYPDARPTPPRDPASEVSIARLNGKMKMSDQKNSQLRNQKYYQLSQLNLKENDGPAAKSKTSIEGKAPEKAAAEPKVDISNDESESQSFDPSADPNMVLTPESDDDSASRSGFSQFDL